MSRRRFPFGWCSVIAANGIVVQEAVSDGGLRHLPLHKVVCKGFAGEFERDVVFWLGEGDDHCDQFGRQIKRGQSLSLVTNGKCKARSKTRVYYVDRGLVIDGGSTSLEWTPPVVQASFARHQDGRSLRE